MSVALPANLKLNVLDALTSLEIGLLPIRQFEGGGAQYRNPADPELRLDFVTSMHRKVGEPVVLAELGTDERLDRRGPTMAGWVDDPLDVAGAGGHDVDLAAAEHLVFGAVDGVEERVVVEHARTLRRRVAPVRSE